MAYNYLASLFSYLLEPKTPEQRRIPASQSGSGAREGAALQEILDKSMAASQAAQGEFSSQRKGPSFDTSGAVGNRAMDADPSLAAKLAMRQSQVGYAPSQIQAFRGLGSSLFLDPRSTLAGQMQQVAASRPIPQQRQAAAPGPGPWGGPAVGDAQAMLRQKRLQDISDAMAQAELTRAQKNSRFADSRESRSQGAYDLLMRLLPQFMGKI